jgi:hypothetical protein
LAQRPATISRERANSMTIGTDSQAPNGSDK